MEKKWLTYRLEYVKGLKIELHTTEEGYDEPDSIEGPGGWDVQNETLEEAVLYAFGNKLDLLTGKPPAEDAWQWLKVNQSEIFRAIEVVRDTHPVIECWAQPEIEEQD